MRAMIAIARDASVMGPGRWARADTFSPVFLVPRDLPRQWQPAIESQVSDRGEENLLFGLVSEVELANNPAFVPGVVNAGNLA